LKKTLEEKQEEPKWTTLYYLVPESRLPTTAYLDAPSWSAEPAGDFRLKAHLPVTDIDGFLRRKKDSAFVVSKFYSSLSQVKDVQAADREKRLLPTPQPSSENILFTSKAMIAAIQSFVDKIPNFDDKFPDFKVNRSISAPYLFWYRYGWRSSEVFSGLQEPEQSLLRLWSRWIDEQYGELYDRVTKQLMKKVISQETMPFLIEPGDVVVREEKGELQAVVAQFWPNQLPGPILHRRKSDLRSGNDKNANTEDREKYELVWYVRGWRYNYDGTFYKTDGVYMYMTLKADALDEEVDVRSLGAYPLRYAPERFRIALEARGRRYWSCRYRDLVSFEDESGLYGTGERFVVHFQTYQQLHCNSAHFKHVYCNIDDPDCKRMDPDIMAREEPPPAPDIYVFPLAIPGYNLRSKKWIDLDIDHIRDVVWNKRSFDHLVIDDETKELIQALVIHQLANEKGTDIIHQKGNGLIILLHGPPGTGKTFTAESVAELAEKPLFRVTCGDIGTKPDQVEKYLESVLHLGKTWGCVVLIDEAEVFLEQRGLDNLERNALVSVFLRVLEYYEGILILTSNRVGTFDEAFKSRILLSLHYENLTRGQRMKIWKNFLTRLKGMEEDAKSISTTTEPGTRKRKFQEESSGIDFDDVDCYLNELADYELNGRQIRNVITTARQLANFRKKPMSFEHLKHVVNVSSKFDKYLKTVQEGYSDDQVARGDGIR
jgi:hypothetical protein